jgi:hypothetical protein
MKNESPKNRMVVKWVFTASILCFLLVVLVSVTQTRALPIFARKYETSCTTCHVIIPKLNPFGIAFRNNGYRIPAADEKFVKQQDVSLGAPAWKQIWPKSVWPGAIPGQPPFALRILTDVRVRPSHDINVDFDMPHELEGYFAGTAGESLGFFGEIEIKNDSSVSLERAYMQFDSLLDNTLFNLKFGRIDLRADPFSRSYRRLTAQHFNVSDLQVVSGQPKLRDRQAGVELWGAATGLNDQGGLEYGLGVVNGVPKVGETNNFKDYYWAASYKLGGVGVAGSVAPSDTLAMTDNYSEYSLLFGGFGYIGKWNKPGEGSPFLEDQYDRIGVKFDAYVNKLNLFGAAMWGDDTLLAPDLTTSRIDSTAFFVEADYVLMPWIVPLFRWEKTNFSDRRNIIQLIPAARLAFRANMALLIEGRFFNKRFKESDERTGTNELRLRFDMVF